MMTSDAIVDTEMRPGAQEVGSTGIAEVLPSTSGRSLDAARRLSQSSQGRIDIPLRKSFLRAPTSSNVIPPMAQLFRRGGRGPAVALKLYLAIIWRCSGGDFRTELSARQFAQLLDLPDPATGGARRITDALERLKELKLVELHYRRGEPTIIQLLDESGSGQPYTSPSGKIIKGKAKPDDPNLFGKVPDTLWTNGHVQSMSAPALAMLLILIAERARPDQPAWFSTEVFPMRYRLTANNRAKGTRELVARRLLRVTKKLVEGNEQTYGRERVRNLYALINDATREAPES